MFQAEGTINAKESKKECIGKIKKDTGIRVKTCSQRRAHGGCGRTFNEIENCQGDANRKGIRSELISQRSLCTNSVLTHMTKSNAEVRLDRQGVFTFLSCLGTTVKTEYLLLLA